MWRDLRCQDSSWKIIPVCSCAKWTEKLVCRHAVFHRFFRGCRWKGSMYQETYVSRNTWKTAEVPLAVKISLSHKPSLIVCQSERLLRRHSCYNPFQRKQLAIWAKLCFFLSCTEGRQLLYLCTSWERS